ncbi:MAG: hypothetical protein ACXVEF_29950 [Polyangiales bacterium]
MRPQLLAHLEHARVSPPTDSIEHAILSSIGEPDNDARHDDEPATRVGLGADQANDGDEHWSNVVELEGDGLLEIHSPSVVDLEELDADWF